MIRSRQAHEAAYREAQRWQERCIAFADETGVGRDATETVSLLADVLLKLGKAGDAIRWARIALEGLGQALAAVGRAADGREHLRAAAGLYAKLGREDDLERVNRALSGA